MNLQSILNEVYVEVLTMNLEGKVSNSIFNLNGRVILNKVLSTNENTIDITNFQSGMYLFKVKSTEGEVVSN